MLRQGNWGLKCVAVQDELPFVNTSKKSFSSAHFLSAHAQREIHFKSFMNIPQESTFITLQIETKFNIMAQKITIPQSPIEKLHTCFTENRREMAQLGDCATSKIFGIGKPFNG